MPWQKIIRHVSDQRVVVRSKSGNEYPCDVEYDYLGEGIYTHMMNEKNTANSDLWAWVSFDGENPVIEDTSRQGKGTGAPDKPPWEH